MLCPFTGPKMFYAGPNFLSQPKNLTASSASSKTFVPAQKPILLNANHLFVRPKCLCLPQYVDKFLVWHNKFGQAHNILGPVKGQGIRNTNCLLHMSYIIIPFLFVFGQRNKVTKMFIYS